MNHLFASFLCLLLFFVATPELKFDPSSPTMKVVVVLAYHIGLVSAFIAGVVLLELRP